MFIKHHSFFLFFHHLFDNIDVSRLRLCHDSGGYQGEQQKSRSEFDLRKWERFSDARRWNNFRDGLQ